MIDYNLTPNARFINKKWLSLFLKCKQKREKSTPESHMYYSTPSNTSQWSCRVK